jgi:hypothetical protein
MDCRNFHFSGNGELSACRTEQSFRLEPTMPVFVRARRQFAAGEQTSAGRLFSFQIGFGEVRACISTLDFAGFV